MRKEIANVVEEEEDGVFLLPAEAKDPRTYKEAMMMQYAPQWDAGYDEEMTSLKTHNVWTLVPRSSVPIGRTIVGSRPHFHMKQNEKGEI
jgi:hypothetical protein